MTALSDLNLQILYYLLDFASKNTYTAATVIFFGHYFLFIIIAAVLYFIYKDFRTGPISGFGINLAGLTVTLIGVYIITESIRHLYPNIRPYAKLGVHNLLTVTTPSFPSGHTIFIFGLATAMYFYNKKLAAFLYISGLLVGIARVAAGVHYPLDILGGIVLGVLAGIIVVWSLRRVL